LELEVVGAVVTGAGDIVAGVVTLEDCALEVFDGTVDGVYCGKYPPYGDEKC
jgi:hypothetical protein